MKKQRLIGLIFATIITLAAATSYVQTPVQAAEKISVTINGEHLSFDQPPAMIDNRTLVPLRAIFEALGATVSWEQSKQTITAVKGSTTVSLQLGNTVAKKNNTDLAIDVAPQTINDRTMVPTRFVAEALGANVGWENSTRTVLITTGDSKTETDSGDNSNGPKTNNSTCISSTVSLENTDMSYESYACHSSDQYAEIGDKLLAELASQGYAFLQDANEEGLEVEVNYPFTDEEETLTTYTVQEGTLVDPIHEDVDEELLPLQNDIERHQELWGLFTWTIPEQYRNVDEFVVFAHDSTSGYVGGDDDGDMEYQFGLNTLNVEPELERISTIVHEFAHLLTASSSQINPTIKEEDCDTYYLGEGCTKPNSYMQAYYENFWVDIEDTVLDFEDDPDLLAEFYLDNQDQFVNDYAATSLDEDVAETFAYFVLNSKPSGNTIKEQKILFFYKYPELVELRANINARLQAVLLD